MLTRVIPDLKFGKLPSAEDHRALFELGQWSMSSMSKSERDFLTSWRKSNFPDPRQAARVAQPSRQLLLDHFLESGAGAGDARGARRGRPPAYRLHFGPGIGLTLPEMAKCKGIDLPNNPGNKWKCGADFIFWVMTGRFVFSFPFHVQLFTALRALENDGWVITTSKQRLAPRLQPEAVAKYTAYVNGDYWAANAVDFRTLVAHGVVTEAGSVIEGWSVSAQASAAVELVRQHRGLTATTSKHIVVGNVLQAVLREECCDVARAEECDRATAAEQDNNEDDNAPSWVSAPQVVQQYCKHLAKTALTPQKLKQMRDVDCTTTIHPPNPFVRALGPKGAAFTLDPKPFHYPTAEVVHPPHFFLSLIHI